MRIQNAIAIITAAIECIAFAGVIYGWPSMELIFDKKGYFSNLCTNGSAGFPTLTAVSDNRTLTCKASTERLNLVFTISSSVMLICLPVGGYISDRFGAWVHRTVSTSMLTLGFLFLAIATPVTPNWLFASTILLGAAGMNLLISNIRVAALCPSLKASILTLFNGAYDSGAVMFFVVDILYDHGYPLQKILIVYTVCTIFSWIVTFTLRPRKAFSQSETQPKYGIFEWKYLCQSVRSDETEKLLDEVLPKTAEIDPNVQEELIQDNRTLKQCICTTMFWSTQIFLSLLNLIVVFFIGSYETWLKGFAAPNKISSLTKTFGMLLLCGILVAPLNGLITDVTAKVFVKLGYSRAKSSWLGLFAATLSSCILAVLFTVSVALRLTYPSFVFFVLTRSFLYASNTSVVALAFPPSHFGKIFGISMMICGITALGQFGIFSLALTYDQNFTKTNYAMIAVAILTFLHPLDILNQSSKVP